jgi:Transposase DDE domain
MRKDKCKSRESKGVYRVRNWSEYNAGLISRGSLTMWIDESAFTSGSEARPLKRGRPQIYSDAMIQAVLTLKHVYHLTLRAAQGFVQSLRDLAFAHLPVPNYDRRKSPWDTTLSRRSQELQVTLPEMASGDPIHLVVDSTGLKLYGEGEWKVRKHGYSKRRTWRKVHLGLDVKTGQIRAALMTHQDVDDASALPGLLAQISADEFIDTIGGDGAYDTKQCHKVIAGRGATSSIPPREGAKPWFESTPGASWRNEAINGIVRDGRDEWKKRSGYHRRSLIENTMYRYKTLTGNCLSARCIGSQATEVAIRVGIVNHMVTLARPQSVRIS